MKTPKQTAIVKELHKACVSALNSIESLRRATNTLARSEIKYDTETAKAEIDEREDAFAELLRMLRAKGFALGPYKTLVEDGEVRALNDYKQATA